MLAIMDSIKAPVRIEPDGRQKSVKAYETKNEIKKKDFRCLQSIPADNADTG